MGDCNMSLNYNCQKNCKYSYSPWCPTCEINSPRRRTRSETSQIECKKKCRDMKSLTPKKYSRCREYENMEYNVKDGWCQTKDSWFETKECCRVRSNLCELPTSYISNNCQTVTAKVDTSDYVVKSKQIFSNSNHLGNMPKPITESKLKLDVIRPHYRPDKVILKNPSPRTNSSSANLIRDNQFCDDYKNCRDYCTLLDLKMHNIQDRSLCYDTTTYFDRREKDSLNLQEKYNNEVEYLRERLLSLKNSSYSIEQPNDGKLFINMMKEKYGEEPVIISKPMQIIQKKSQRKIISPPNSRVRSKVTLKTRNNAGRIASAKVKKVKPKTPTPITESECSSDSEPEVDEIEQDVISEQSTTDSEDKQIDQKGLTKCINETGSGDANLIWPIRNSLFPHIPPYISFTSHDSPIPMKFPMGGKFFKWKLTTITPILVRQTLSNSGFSLVRKSNQWLGTWGKHMKSPMFKTLKETQKINHFPGTFQLGRKDRLWRNFQRLINKFGHKEFGFIPHSYILPQELKLLKQNWEFKNGNGGEMWIIKPPASARGVGIKVINKWSQLPKKMSLVVQKYIPNPYLINGSKFDLRLYVLVTSFHPLRIYLYPDGLARFASAKYSDNSKDLKDRYRHLTNYSINKLSDQYTANEDANACQGHKWTLSKLMEYLEGKGVNSKSLWKNLQQLVIKTMISAESPITQLCEENMNSIYNCYELFGVDVLLDEDLKPWLLEVNISPSLHSASPLDAHVKGPMVQTLFDMAQFHIPSKATQNCSTPSTFNPKLYTLALTKNERLKHVTYEEFVDRSDYVNDILDQLTGDDVRQLTRAEDEYAAKGRFERIFPTAHTHRYLEFMEPRYYNRLCDAWESKYGSRRQEGVNYLKSLCSQRIHLKTAHSSKIRKNSLSTIPGDMKLLPSKEGQTRPLEEMLRNTSLASEVLVCAN